MQINSIHGIDPATLIDPTVNIQAAYRVYQSQGLRAWSVYNSFKKEYDDKIKNNEYTKAGKIKAENKLRSNFMAQTEM